MGPSCCPIAVIEGADAPRIQCCLADFAAGHSDGLRIAGVIEVFPDPDANAACKQSFLRSLGDRRDFALFQDLGVANAASALLPADGRRLNL